MPANNFSSVSIGWMAIATGIASILALVLIILFFTIGQPFGTLNDIFNGIAGILSGVLAWMLYTEYHAKSPLSDQVALIFALVGALVVVVGSILVIFQITGWVLAGLYTSAGNALIGLWLIAFCYSMQQSSTLPHNLVIFGLVCGVFMAVGLIVIPGIFAGTDTMESAPWYINIGYLGFLGTYILYPIWTFWLGQILLSMS